MNADLCRFALQNIRWFTRLKVLYLDANILIIGTSKKTNGLKGHLKNEGQKAHALLLHA